MPSAADSGCVPRLDVGRDEDDHSLGGALLLAPLQVDDASDEAGQSDATNALRHAGWHDMIMIMRPTTGQGQAADRDSDKDRAKRRRWARLTAPVAAPATLARSSAVREEITTRG